MHHRARKGLRTAVGGPRLVHLAAVPELDLPREVAEAAQGDEAGVGGPGDGVAGAGPEVEDLLPLQVEQGGPVARHRSPPGVGFAPDRIIDVLLFTQALGEKAAS